MLHLGRPPLTLQLLQRQGDSQHPWCLSATEIVFVCSNYMKTWLFKIKAPAQYIVSRRDHLILIIVNFIDNYWGQIHEKKYLKSLCWEFINLSSQVLSLPLGLLPYPPKSNRRMGLRHCILSLAYFTCTLVGAGRGFRAKKWVIFTWIVSWYVMIWSNFRGRGDIF